MCVRYIFLTKCMIIKLTVLDYYPALKNNKISVIYKRFLFATKDFLQELYKKTTKINADHMQYF